MLIETALSRKRGIATIDDLRANSRIDPLTGCWHYLGAFSAGVPKIHTYDPERGDKRVMSGPRAVWCIAHGRAPYPGHKPYRRCGSLDCVNPVHHTESAGHWALFRVLAQSGRLKGLHTEQKRKSAAKARAAAGITDTPVDIVLAIKRAPPWVTGRKLAQQHGVSNSTVSRIRRGENFKWVAP